MKVYSGGIVGLVKVVMAYWFITRTLQLCLYILNQCQPIHAVPLKAHHLTEVEKLDNDRMDSYCMVVVRVMPQLYSIIGGRRITQ